MFIMLIMLLALNVTLYIRFNKRINYLEDLFTNTFKPFSSDITSVYSHINSIYQTIKTLSETVAKHKTLLDAIDMKCSTMVSNVSTYVHKDNDANKKELINCMANSFTDMMTYISNTVRNTNKERNLNINDEMLADIKERITSIQQTFGDTNIKDIKVVSSEELTKISSMLKDTQNQLDCISKQIEAFNKLKTATKSKSTKSDKSEAKHAIRKKAIIL